jgi:hypothetical protein
VSDPYRKVQPGEQVEFSATAWNAMLSAGLAIQQKQFDRLSGDLTSSRQSTIIRVRNDTGTELVQRSVVGIDGAIFNPADSVDGFLREVALKGIVPTEAHRGRFAILLEPAPLESGSAQRVVRAYIAGVTQVRVNVVFADDRRCDVDPGNTGALISGGSGGAEIIWREGDDDAGFATGEQWAVVRVGAGAGDRMAQLPGAAIAPGASGTVTFYVRGSGGSLSLGSETATARNDWNTATAASKKCLVGWVSGALVIKNWEC